MKKWIQVLLAGLLAVSLLAGCNGGTAETVTELEASQVLSVRNRTSGKVFSINDIRKDVRKSLGGEEVDYITFDEEGIERAYYENAEGCDFDFMHPLGGEVEEGADRSKDRVVAMRLTENDDWEIVGGLRVGLDEQEVRAMFEDNEYVQDGLRGGLLLAYDSDLKPMAFDNEAPYIITITFEEGAVDYICIQDNFEE